MFQSKNFKNIFLIYLLFLYFVAIYYLFIKHTGGADSTISEWLVNYYGGFTRRGLSGHIFAQISILFSLIIYFLLSVFSSQDSILNSFHTGRLMLFSGNPIPFSFCMLGAV